METSELRLLVDFAALTFSVGAVIYAHWRTLHTARREELVSLRERLTKAEAKLEETPTSKAIHELALSISVVSGELKANTARLEGLGEIVKRLDRITERQESYLLTDGKKA